MIIQILLRIKHPDAWWHPAALKNRPTVTGRTDVWTVRRSASRKNPAIGNNTARVADRQTGCGKSIRNLVIFSR
jgi:hypothetical protein